MQTRRIQNGDGAYVGAVTPGTPAAGGGVQVGDTIVAVGGEHVTVPEDISAAIEGRKPGETVDVEVQRAGSRKTLHVTLGTRPETTGTYDPSTP